MQVGTPADGLELFLPRERLTDGDGVDGVSRSHQLQRRVVDTAMRVEREVFGLETAGRVGDGDRIEHHRAENGDFGVERGGKALDILNLS